MKANNEKSPELQVLLRAKANQVPQRDLGDSFLDDLHNRIDAKNVRPSIRFSLPEFPRLAWAGVGASFAAITVGLITLYSLNTDRDLQSISDMKESQEVLLVSTDSRVVDEGVIPHYIVKPLEF